MRFRAAEFRGMLGYEVISSFSSFSSRRALRLSFRSIYLGIKIFLDLLGYRNIVNTMELEQQPNASVLD